MQLKEKNDGNKFVKDYSKEKPVAVVNKIQNNLNNKHQIKVKDTLKFLTFVSKIIRKISIQKL